MIINKNKLFLLIFLFFVTAQSQTDWVRWGKSDPDYKISVETNTKQFDFSIYTFGDIVLKPVINAYRFFISDVDGDNCPFYPTCSAFLLASVQRTNIFQGTLMFFDRFSRDTNIFEREKHYPFYGKHHFYDPVDLYTLDKDLIKVIPAATQVKETK
ncbi:MAG: membrane protein insertion efficiency factor YidD [Ignavibacteriota bacterium]|nr:membrane protein insertion efficiency factor YidD [Ignavibacterium sp.]MCO6448634.1 membrane protein insertion efficiency factor YidD [Ignavibacterium album]MCZ2268920.1 membrane protein insertion efficiency factor YidD [Ignavibacteriales bacterium]QKJ98477.1 MAG: membrane protein insertion efficiency factor YidD [Ignavibacteriota bacterium]